MLLLSSNVFSIGHQPAIQAEGKLSKLEKYKGLQQENLFSMEHIFIFEFSQLISHTQAKKNEMDPKHNSFVDVYLQISQLFSLDQSLQN